MLQIINIKLKVKQNTLLNYDYNYALACEIYKKIQLIDNEFGIGFHNNGLRKNKSEKPFKLMTMMLQFNNAIMDKEGIILNANDKVNLEIRGTKQVLNKILNGFMSDNSINIDGNIFEFERTEIKAIPNFKNTNLYKVESILIETLLDNNKKSIYLDAFNPRYVQTIKQNLKNKYKLIYNKEYTGELKIGIEDFMQIKTKSIKVKNHNIIGSGKFNIIIQADRDIQKVAYCCGLGTHNTYGAGFLKYITGGN